MYREILEDKPVLRKVQGRSDGLLVTAPAPEADVERYRLDGRDEAHPEEVASRGSRPALLLGLRLDAAPVVTELDRYFDLYDIPTAAKEQPRCLDDPPDFGDHQSYLDAAWYSVTAVHDAIELYKDEYGLVGVLLWNTVQPLTRMAARAAQKFGLPAFEIDHGALATYWHGHFEADPAADHIFCSPEHAQFLKSYGYAGQVHETGRPKYDHWGTVPKSEMKKLLGIPIDMPVVMHNTTWTHALSQWSDPHLAEVAELIFLHAMRIVQHVMPEVGLLWSIRSGAEPEEDWVMTRLKTIGLTNVMVDKGKDTYELLHASDVVCGPKGSALAEGVLAGIPAICVDMRPNLDDWAWKGKGILTHRNTHEKELAELILRCIGEEKLRSKLAEERKDGQLFFNGPGNASVQIAETIRRITCPDTIRTLTGSTT